MDESNSPPVVTRQVAPVAIDGKEVRNETGETLVRDILSK